MRTTFHVELVALSDQQYKLYVFKNLDEEENSMLRYITVTRCPNWEGYCPVIGDKGYIHCEYVDAGQDYFNRATGTTDKYNYSNIYFLNFIKETKEIINKEFKM